MRFNNVQKIIDKIRNKKQGISNKTKYKPLKSFSQSGEDLIVNYMLRYLFDKSKINYLDIGAHHSKWLSNTKLFYDNKGSCVLIEHDPTIFKEIKKNRKRDICLNCGIGLENQESADFYIMDSTPINTFSKESAYRAQNELGHKIEKIIKIPLVKVNDIFEKYFNEGCDFLSIDVEGLEMQILNSMDFEKYRPKVICIETREYGTDELENDIIDMMKAHGYIVYADTHLNTIFLDSKAKTRFSA